MATSRCRTRRALVFGTLVALAASPPGASAHRSSQVPTLKWRACPNAADFQCASASVPKDYGVPEKGKIRLALTRLPATDQQHRIGSLFVNFGGPGGDAVDTLQAKKGLFHSLNDRFDIVGFDPRGVGQSKPSIDCKANQETQGIYRQPFTTPENLDVNALIHKDKAYIRRCLDLNRGILPYVSTANVARDMDVLRAAVGDEKLTYLGFSYGTFLGATYESMFPTHYRALVLDGAVDADQYINRPTESLQEQSAAFERALSRFFLACAAHKDVCPFGGDDPGRAFDDLVGSLNAQPLPATGSDPRPVDGQDALVAANLATYAKQRWPMLAAALTQAAAGEGTALRVMADAFYGRADDGSYDASSDRYFTIGALEQRYPRNVRFYLDAGRHSFGMFDHAWWNTGYTELGYGLYPVKPKGVFYGPFRANPSATTTLVVATRYDPATPYRGSEQLVTELGNARLLEMRGDGHTAYSRNSPCIDSAVDAYLKELTAPAKGTVCEQELPFQAPEPAAARIGSSHDVKHLLGPTATSARRDARSLLRPRVL
jgi:pimeloyl-ACP methyl ester carboxylesterase